MASQPARAAGRCRSQHCKSATSSWWTSAGRVPGMEAMALKRAIAASGCAMEAKEGNRIKLPTIKQRTPRGSSQRTSVMHRWRARSAANSSSSRGTRATTGCKAATMSVSLARSVAAAARALSCRSMRSKAACAWSSLERWETHSLRSTGASQVVQLQARGGTEQDRR